LGRAEHSGFGRQPFFGPVELMVRWTCMLDGARDGRAIAIESSRHEFRTAGAPSGVRRRDLKMRLTRP